MYEGKIFQWELEYTGDGILRRFYEARKIKAQVNYTLTKFPRETKSILDLETPDNYIEVKRGWGRRRSQEIQYLKTKTYWFISQDKEKEFILVVNNKKIFLPGVRTILVSELEGYLYGKGLCREK